ncbi:dipeptide epimerase [Candidatus Bipolaricaulota bacterium]|nr:dipeptide epimerase [Candidatus Bipolaricaulota bacterium]
MRVVEARVFRFRFVLDRPFRIATGYTTEKEEVVVRLADDAGHVGWGEASPSPVILSATADTVVAALDTLIPVVLGEDPRRLGHLVDAMDRVLRGHSPAKAALDIALHDLVGQITGEPVWRMLGGSRSGPVDTDFTVGLDAPEAMAAEAKALVAAGFRTIKVKVGEDPQVDVVRVQAIRDAVGDAVTIRIDANQGWTRPEAVWALTRMAEYDVQFAEQPVAAEDIEGLAWVRRRSPIPVMADEAVHSPQDALRVVRADAVDYVNIKLMKAGGLWRAREIAAICGAAGIPCMIGGMVESNLSATAAVHFALAAGNVIFRDLDIGEWPETRLVTDGGARIDGGCQVLADPDAPGLGIRRLYQEWLVPIKTYRVGEGGGKRGGSTA